MKFIAPLALALLLGVRAEPALAGHFPAPPALAPGFAVSKGDARFAGPCRPDTVVRRVTVMLTALNEGRSSAFSQSFRLSGMFHPYAGARRIGTYYPGPSGVRGRQWIARAARSIGPITPGQL